LDQLNTVVDIGPYVKKGVNTVVVRVESTQCEIAKLDFEARRRSVLSSLIRLQFWPGLIWPF